MPHNTYQLTAQLCYISVYAIAIMSHQFILGKSIQGTALVSCDLKFGSENSHEYQSTMEIHECLTPINYTGSLTKLFRHVVIVYIATSHSLCQYATIKIVSS